MKLLEKFKYNINAKKKKTKFILSFIGAIMYKIAYVTSMGISSFNVYITSYFHYQKIDIDMQYGNLINPISFFLFYLFRPISGYIEQQLGLYLTLIISIILLEIDLFLFINQTNIFFSFILTILLGISNGIGMDVPGKNVFFYYPSKNGIISALIGMSLLIFSTIFNITGEKIINPEKYTIPKGEKFYPLEISQNYKIFYKYILFINPFIQIIALFLIQKYNSNDDEELIQENSINDIEKKDKSGNIKKDEYYIKNLKSVFLNKRIWRIIGITIFSSFAFNFTRNTFRVYGALNSISGTIMQYSSLFTLFPTILSSPIWGYIIDKYKYEIIIKVLCSSFLIKSIILSILTKSNTIYLVCFSVGSILANGFINISSLHILRVYGIKYCLEIGGIIGIFQAIVGILYALLSFIISKYYHTGEELQFAYRFVYIGGIVIGGIGLFLALYEKEDKFIYPYLQKKKKEYINMINSDFKEKQINEPKEFELELESNSSDKTLDSV